MSEMLKKFVSAFNLIIPFLEPYPTWVKAVIGGWILLTAFIVICLLFCRTPKEKVPIQTEKIELQFIYTLFFHKSDKKPLDEHYNDEHKFGGRQFDVNLLNFINTRIEQDQELKKAEFNKDREKIVDFYHDLVFIKVLSRFFWMYADWWDIRIDSVRRGNSLTYSVSPIKPIPDCNNILEWKDLLERLDNNDSFHQLLSSFSSRYFVKKITLPPKTNIDFKTSRYGKELVLTNPFVHISIAIDKRSGSIGLGDYQWFLGYDSKESDEFWSEHFNVNCKAKFEKFSSGHPNIARYKRWVETMFNEVQEQLDEARRLKRAKEYRDLIKS